MQRALFTTIARVVSDRGDFKRYCALSTAVVVLLAGTRMRREEDHPARYLKTAGFHCYGMGYDSHSNKHAGVMVCLNARRWKTKHVAGIAWPSAPGLSGRALFVRTRRANVDICFAAVYVPPAAPGGGGST